MPGVNDASLARYADAIVRDGLLIGPGDTLAVHPEPIQRELAVALTEAGYRAGARYVDVLETDPARHARARARPRPRTRSTGAPPGRTRACASSCARARASSGSPAARTRRRSPTCLRRARRGASSTAPACRRTGARSAAQTHASSSWPGRRPPGLRRSTPSSRADAGVAALGDDLLHFARLGADDPADGWRVHAERLAERAARLSALDLREMRLTRAGHRPASGAARRHDLARGRQRRARPPHHAEHPHRGGVHEPGAGGDDAASSAARVRSRSRAA